MTTLPKEIQKIIDGLAESGSQNGPYQPYDSNSFKSGAKVAWALAMERVKPLVEALKYYERPIGLSSNTNDYLNGYKVAEGAIKEWQEFVGSQKCECEHEPTIDSIKSEPLNIVTCKMCGVRLKAKWEAVNNER